MLSEENLRGNWWLEYDWFGYKYDHDDNYLGFNKQQRDEIDKMTDAQLEWKLKKIRGPGEFFVHFTLDDQEFWFSKEKKDHVYNGQFSIVGCFGITMEKFQEDKTHDLEVLTCQYPSFWGVKEIELGDRLL